MRKKKWIAAALAAVLAVTAVPSSEADSSFLDAESSIYVTYIQYNFRIYCDYL